MLLHNFLIERLSNVGIKHVFGVPGDSILEFYHELSKSKNIQLITNTDETHSSFAADAYARINGAGCVVVTYGVGASKVINAVQCAYAERSPLIVISGIAGVKEKDTIFQRNLQKSMFDNITCDSIVLDNPATAGYLIDHALEKMQYYKRPIYIELPCDMVKQSISYDVYKQGTPTAPTSDQEELQESLAEVESWIKDSENPVILAGVELGRYNMGDALVKFAERNNIPVVTTVLSKSTVNELHPLYKGIYCGQASKPEVMNLVENSDCLLMLGVVSVDNIVGGIPAKTKKRLAVMANIYALQIKSHNYSCVGFVDFCKSLFKKDFGRGSPSSTRARMYHVSFEPQSKPITTDRLFEQINAILDSQMTVVCDIGDCMYGAVNLTVHGKFLCPALYASMGGAIAGALGAQLASPTRSIVVVGDGAAQMSLLELSTIANRGLNPIIFILNNEGFLTQRLILEGEYNNIRSWDYSKITNLIGAGVGYDVKDEHELNKAVELALGCKQLSVINVHIDPKGMSSGLKRMLENRA